MTRPGDAPIETDVLWLPLQPEDSGLEITRVVQRQPCCLRVDAVGSAPPGTLIQAPDANDAEGTPRNWRVDEIQRVEADLIRVLVAPLADDEVLRSWGNSGSELPRKLATFPARHRAQ